MGYASTITCRVLWGLLFAFAQQAALAGCGDPPRPGVDWNKCDKRRLILKDIDLSKGRFAGTDFGRSDLSGTKLVEADMIEASIDRTALRTADLSRAKLARSNAYRADFTGAKLIGADLTKAELARTVFRWADLSGAILEKAELPRALLQGAVLSRAKLVGADLSRAILGDAVLSGADFTGTEIYRTRIEGVDLSSVVGLTQPQLDSACGNPGTKLPKGLNHPAAWPCRKDE